MFFYPSTDRINDTFNKFGNKCEMCNEKPKKDFYSQTVTYFRNLISSEYFFCSEDCKTKFDRSKKCWYCGYHGDLKYVPSEDFMLCTSDEHWNPTCYQKYLDEEGLGNCIFCKSNDVVKVIDIKNNDINQDFNDGDFNINYFNCIENIDTLHLCAKCLYKYQLIKLNCDD